MFNRVLQSAPSLSIGCPSAGDASGIATVFWSSQSDLSGCEVDVECFVGGKQIGKNFGFSADRPEKDRWFAVHTHLLPNGPVDLRVHLLQGSREAAQQITIVVNNEGNLAASVRESLIGAGTPLLVEGCDSGHYDYEDKNPLPWFDRPNAEQTIAEWLAAGKIAQDEADHLRDFVRKGFIVLPDFIATDLVDRINGEIDDAIARNYQGYEYGKSTRLEKLHEHYPGVRELWVHDGVMRLLRILFQSEPRPCQTLTYVFGSQQDAHQDTIHLTPFPAGYMCGVWVALEDVKPNSGELEVYVGSHRLPRARMRDVGLSKVNGDWTAFGETVVPLWQHWISEGGFEKVVYRPKRGSVLIWHENLMHAGSVRRDMSLSRRSIVSHVFADGAIAYYDSSGLPGYLEPRKNLNKALPATA